MFRGTTPTLKFTIPFECSEITAISVAFAQDEKLILEKNISQCQMTGKVITLTLTEDDTLLFNCEKKHPKDIPKVEIQLRVACGTTRLASQIITCPVERILKEGRLNG